jgi:hypothetical protein
MKSPSRLRHSVAAVLALSAAGSCPALTLTEWQHQQALVVPAPGLVRVELNTATFDGSQPQLGDLRVVDPDGREVPFLIDWPSVVSPRRILPAQFEVRQIAPGSTQITIVTGTGDKLASLFLETPVPFFLRAAQVEISGDRTDWVTLDQGLPIFREWGAEKLDLPLGGHSGSYLRVTISDNRDAPMPFTGMRILTQSSREIPLVSAGGHIAHRDEFAGETVLTLSLDGRESSLAALDIDSREPLFMRRVTVAVRDVHNGVPGERTVGEGTISRVALAGAPAHEQLEMPLLYTPSTPELLVHIHNGDSPPLAIDSVHLKRYPVGLLLMAPVAGSYVLLSGNPQATAPHYDLAAFAGEMNGAPASSVSPGSIGDTPGYHASEALGTPPMPDVPLTGAPLDATEWAGRRTVQITDPGVEELELDLEALSRTRPDYGDLRLLRGGNQIPYILEQPSLARSLNVIPDEEPDPKRASFSIWKLRLPKAELPLRSIALTSATPLFQRQFRVFEKIKAQDGGTYDNVLSSGEWSRTPQPGVPETRVFELQGRVQTDTIWIEADNGDNPAIALGTAQVAYPVVRLVFKAAQGDGFTLAYENIGANAPRYDLGLVAGRLLTSNRNVAHLGTVVLGTPARNPFAGINGGYVFWAALALVVIVLLVLVAKLLPKPPA